MGVVTPIRTNSSVFISTASNFDLWTRLQECDRDIRRHEGVVDSDQTMSTRVRESYRLLDVIRGERADIEAALNARFLSWAGVTLDAFAGVLL